MALTEEMIIYEGVKEFIAEKSKDTVTELEAFDLFGDGEEQQAKELLEKASREFGNKRWVECCLTATKLQRLTWEQLNQYKQWPHVCWRETSIFSSLFYAVAFLFLDDQQISCKSPDDNDELNGGEKENEGEGEGEEANLSFRSAWNTLDRAFIFGGPKDVLQPVADALERKQQRKQGNITAVVDVAGVKKRIEANDPIWLIPTDCKVSYDDIERRSPSKPVQEVGIEALTNQLLSRSEPVVCRKAVRHWRNWSCIERWRDLKYFMEKFGHRFIPIELGYSTTKTWKELVMPFNQFITQYLLPSNASSSSDSIDPEHVAYCAQHSLIDHLPALGSDFTLPPFFSSSSSSASESSSSSSSSQQPDLHLQRINAWFGTSHTITPLHFDSYYNLFVQIQGFKYIRLYAADQTPFLYVISKESLTTGSSSSIAAQGNLSQVVCEHEDFTQFPLAAQAHYTDTILGPGDCLFIPAGVWHYVRSLTPSFSLNFWFVPDLY